MNPHWKSNLRFIILFLLTFVRTSNIDDDNKFPFETVVDILSNDVQFSTFLRLVQRKGYVPYLNELQNFTLFAPVNSAFIVNDEGSILGENQFDLENYLLHNLTLNLSVRKESMTIINQYVKFPFIIDSINKTHRTPTVNNIRITEPDLKPNFQNAYIQGISGLISTPPPIKALLTYLQENPKYNNEFTWIEKFASKFENLEDIVQNNTFLLPSNSNIRKFYNQIEANYLIDNFSQKKGLDRKIQDKWDRDALNFLQSIILKDVTGGSNLHNTLRTNLNNVTLVLENCDHSRKITVNHSSPSILTNEIFVNGIAHGFIDIDAIVDVVQFDAEKYLHGLNNSKFVEEIYFRKLQHLIQDESSLENITIFVPEPSLNDDIGFTKSTILYHFVKEQLWLEENEALATSAFSSNANRYLIDSSFCSSNKRLGGKCQKLKISKTNEGYFINNKIKILNTKPYKIGSSLIYTISKDIALPGDFLLSLPPLYHCSRSIELLKQLDLLTLAPNYKGYTIFLPCFDAWTEQDLIFNYLESNLTAANISMKNLIINGLYYTVNSLHGKQTTNLLGNEVLISTEEDSYDSDIATEFMLSTMKDPISVEKNSDIIFDQGVIHPLRDINFPKDLFITLKDLIKTAGVPEFLEFLENFQEFSSIFAYNESYSLLVPTQASLIREGINLNFTSLKEFLKLHIVTGNSTVNLLGCKGKISTLSGYGLSCNEVSKNNLFLHVDSGSNKEVRILKKGCSTVKNSSCVFLIDRPISLNWLQKERYYLKLPGVAIGIGVLLGALFTSLLCFILVLPINKTKETSQIDDNSQYPPLPTNEQTLTSNYGSTHGTPSLSPRFDDSYSPNSKRKPIGVGSSPHLNRC
ncbi:uncharacterized protein NDAI_0C02280 [Naumovozyma dairenensis CBS 421]|uniref:FAS1 domain-containing protein n=1 Tax=Naumovozyma dairenensis (strain ATCC 10597 / BCRC 20456 / CBS 421 / NBRC 0211 / NRRL Y-12639) TaxID=1071378 RepID=G0W7X7_NAUDC|nr:hypothetical protein NDAI_0C02280 [Naumovozyma dairenensis CBS 421]CCD23888.1 hypothetical protein NDAI_0C02280 [Naumovozyma dairenensis CBS 421]